MKWLKHRRFPGKIVNPLVIAWIFALGAVMPGEASPRIVSTSPQITELLFQLGKGADIVATSQMSLYPEAAKKIPIIGSAFMPGIESIVRFSPDWVLLDPAANPAGLESALGALKLPYLLVSIPDVNALFSVSESILQKIYHESQSAIIGRFRKCQKQFEGKGTPENFLAFAWFQPPILFGSKTFLSNVIEGGGGINQIPPSWKVSYPEVSEEWLVKQNVDAIYFLDSGGMVPIAQRISEKWWPKRKIRLTALPSEIFARATFTPLLHLNDLRSSKIPVPEQCRVP